MAYKVVTYHSVDQFLEHIPAEEREPIERKIEGLETEPWPVDCTLIEDGDPQVWLLCEGEYQITYAVLGEQTEVHVTTVRKPGLFNP